MAADVHETRLLDTAAGLRRITEAGAVAAAEWIGAGVEHKNDADQAAVDAMDAALIQETSGSSLTGVIVKIGEGEKDEAPLLRHGKFYGREGARRLGGYVLDLAVDPVENTTSVATGQEGGMTIAALGERGSFPSWLGVAYMRKLIVGPGVPAALMDEGVIGLDRHPSDNMTEVAQALDIPLSELRVAVLDRKRNEAIIQAAQDLGVQLTLLQRGDVLPAMQVCLEDGTMDMVYGSGGAPEGVISAVLAACTGGNMQGMWDPQTHDEEFLLEAMGQLGHIKHLKQLVGTGELHFAATGITDSTRDERPLLRGCRKVGGTWLPTDTIVASRQHE